jgi:hypothetical protein
MQASTYPVQFSIDYPDRPLNRVTTAFRILTAIPILLLLGTVSGQTWHWDSGRGGQTAVAAGAEGPAVLAPLLMIVFRRTYPRWWFNWNRELQRFGNA